MHMLMTMLMVSVLWLGPLMTEAGTAGTTGPAPGTETDHHQR